MYRQYFSLQPNLNSEHKKRNPAEITNLLERKTFETSRFGWLNKIQITNYKCYNRTKLTPSNRTPPYFELTFFLTIKDITSHIRSLR